MRYLFFIIIILVLVSCKRYSNNIEIKSEDLRLAIKQFYKDVWCYSKGSKNNTISTSYEKGNEYIKIGLYSNGNSIK